MEEQRYAMVASRVLLRKQDEKGEPVASRLRIIVGVVAVFAVAGASPAHACDTVTECTLESVGQTVDAVEHAVRPHVEAAEAEVAKAQATAEATKRAAEADATAKKQMLEQALAQTVAEAQRLVQEAPGTALAAIEDARRLVISAIEALNTAPLDDVWSCRLEGRTSQPG